MSVPMHMQALLPAAITYNGFHIYVRKLTYIFSDHVTL